MLENCLAIFGLRFLQFLGYDFLGLDGPYLALLGPLLASMASDLTPSTWRNPVSTRGVEVVSRFGRICQKCDF